MDYIIEQRLKSIEQMARHQQEVAQQILRDIQGIYGYCMGMEMVAKDYETNTTLQLNQLDNKCQEIVSQPKTIEEIIQEVKEMIIELKIKGSVREHRDGLLKFTSTMLDKPIYGRSKEEIEEKLKNKIKELKNKSIKPKKKDVELFSTFFNDSYLPYKKKTLKSDSIEGIEVWFRFIVKSGLDKPLNRYTSSEIEKFLYSIPLTRKRQMVRGVFNNLFNYAKKLGKIKANPCDNVDRMKHEKENGNAMNFKDQLQFFTALYNSDNIKITESERMYLTFVYLTGTRRREALDLSIKDVDWENNVLHIPGTKTNGSDRIIPLFPLVRRILEKITPQKNGKYFKIVPNAASACIKKITTDYHLHELRHTFGTIAICVQKLDAKTVSLWMGHSTVGMTLQTYTHPEQLDKALFYNGNLREEEKLESLKQQYRHILDKIEKFLG